MPVFSFLENYDLSGKDIYPISTHKGSFLGSSVTDIKKLCPDSNIHLGVPIAGGSTHLLGIIPIVVIAAFTMIFAGSCIRYRSDVKTKSAHIGGVLVIIGLITVLACLIRVII